MEAKTAVSEGLSFGSALAAIISWSLHESVFGLPCMGHSVGRTFSIMYSLVRAKLGLGVSLADLEGL